MRETKNSGFGKRTTSIRGKKCCRGVVGAVGVIVGVVVIAVVGVVIFVGIVAIVVVVVPVVVAVVVTVVLALYLHSHFGLWSYRQPNSSNELLCWIPTDIQWTSICTSVG